VIEIKGVDQGSGPNTGVVTVTVVVDDVNDNTPAITGTPYDKSISEFTPVNFIIFDIDATDLDVGVNAQLTYTIALWNTDSDFKIDSGSGIIMVAKALDHERTTSYHLKIIVSDNGLPSLSSTVTASVTITDENDHTPTFGRASYSFTVAENVPATSSVGLLVATDLDDGVNSAITYSIVTFWSGDASHFSIDGSTGVISTSGGLDRELLTTYSFDCRVEDAGINPPRYSDVTVTITVTDTNDQDPLFPDDVHTALMAENLAVGFELLTVSLTWDDDTGVNEQITLSIDTSTTAGARADLFLEVNSTTHIISVKSNVDRETDTDFNFIVQAVDGGIPPRTSTASVSITVLDMNDNTPVFSPMYYNTEAPYVDKCQTVLATITATDADIDLNGQFIYYLEVFDFDHLFSLGGSNGKLFFTFYVHIQHCS
jgi:hypothetical protein